MTTETAASLPADGAMRITRVTLHDAVLNQLRDMIIDGRLAPGARINEGQVGASLGVSRTPLREAIKTLASEGLIEIIPAKGAIVRRFSESDVREILEVIKALELAAARHVCERASDGELAGIRKIHEDMKALYGRKDRLGYFKLDQETHSAIVRAAGNAVMLDAHDKLQARIKQVRYGGARTPENWAKGLAEHDAIIAALMARDAERLITILGQHLDGTVERIPK
ncbi:MAG: GntR family transcriptional regulator [Rhizobiales bacterium PAR1]|nr:MAG: GntR family transcriptional regulator [Rhizobiales bacterium PAR1]